jgi:hypothetical protein
MQTFPIFKKLATLALLVGLFMTARRPVLLAQESQGDQEQNIDTYVELLRKDVKTQKVAIIGQLMQLSPEQSSAFWPIYSEYDKELTALGNEKLKGIKDYAAHYSSLTEEKAKELANLALALEEKRIALKRKYLERFQKAVSPKMAAKFLQIENQLLMLIDLQIASNLPIVH